MSKAPLWKDFQNGTMPMLDFSVANVSQLVSASQAACLVGQRGFAITSNVSESGMPLSAGGMHAIAMMFQRRTVLNSAIGR